MLQTILCCPSWWVSTNCSLGFPRQQMFLCSISRLSQVCHMCSVTTCSHLWREQWQTFQCCCLWKCAGTISFGRGHMYVPSWRSCATWLVCDDEKCVCLFIGSQSPYQHTFSAVLGLTGVICLWVNHCFLPSTVRLTTLPPELLDLWFPLLDKDGGQVQRRILGTVNKWNYR